MQKYPANLSPRGSLQSTFIPSPKKLLGQILVDRGVISSKHLELALEQQKREGGKYLGEILLKMGVQQEKINEALDTFRTRKPIGEILVDSKAITREQLDTVLKKQEELKIAGRNKPLGALIVEMGYVNNDGYMTALSKHFNMPIVSLDHFFPSPDLQKAVGQKYAEKNKILVLENSLQAIKLALADPNIRLMDELRLAFPRGKKVEFYLISPYQYHALLRKRFDPFSVSNYR